MYALARCAPEGITAADHARILTIRFLYALGFITRRLAHMLDSLVRVSRRVGLWSLPVLRTFPHPFRGQLVDFPEFASLCMISRTFHFLFKVLFIFPSRYLFAIGLSRIFRFRWNIPPILCCSPKQHDSQYSSLTEVQAAPYGASTLYGQAFKPS